MGVFLLGKSCRSRSLSSGESSLISFKNEGCFFRERIVTQTPREQLLNEVQTIAHARSDTAAAIPAGFVRQLSQSSNNPQNAEMPQPPAAPIFLKPASERKLKEKKEELSTHEELMRQISRSRTVPDQFIADGTVKANGVPPPPPAPIAPPQLKKVNVKVFKNTSSGLKIRFLI